MQIKDLVDIKSRNVKAILDCIRQDGPLTKKDIADRTNLSQATASNLCNELRDAGITEDIKNASSRVGRTAYRVSLRKNRYLNIILDFRIENLLSLAIVNIKNDLIYHSTLDTANLKTPEEIVTYAHQTFLNLIDTLKLHDAIFLRVGAAVPAIFDSGDGRLKTCTIHMFENTPLKDMLSKAFGIKAYVDNIANFCALSAFSRASNQSCIVCLDISQGVGVGVIVNNSLIRGKNGYGSEIAHVPIGEMNSTCAICQRNGCAEILLSVMGMVGLYKDIPHNIPMLKRWQMFVNKMQAGNQQALNNAEKIGLQMGRLASILINMFDPSYFSISGYIVDIIDLVQPYVMLEINARSPLSIERGLKLEISKNAFDSVYIGVSDALYDSWNPLDETIICTR